MKYDDILNSLKAPVRISFEPTITCNLRCPMCDRTQKSDFSKHRDEQLPYEVTKSFLHDVGRLGTRYFLFIGGGEPLTDPHILEYMEILRSYGVYVHLWTNGTLINEGNRGCKTYLKRKPTLNLNSSESVFLCKKLNQNFIIRVFVPALL